jgi:hypothetical protein
MKPSLLIPLIDDPQELTANKHCRVVKGKPVTKR